MILAGWQWIFYLVTIITLPGALLAAFLIPAPSQLEHAAAAADVEEKAASASHVAPAHVRPPKMDYLGLLLLTGAIVLLIFGLSDGNVEGFDRAQSIAPLVLGVVLFPAFFFWETRINPLDALINPATWNVKNFTLLTVLSLVPYVSISPISSLTSKSG
jgi:MFS family permease